MAIFWAKSGKIGFFVKNKKNKLDFSFNIVFFKNA